MQSIVRDRRFKIIKWKLHHLLPMFLDICLSDVILNILATHGQQDPLSNLPRTCFR